MSASHFLRRGPRGSLIKEGSRAERSQTKIKTGLLLQQVADSRRLLPGEEEVQVEPLTRLEKHPRAAHAHVKPSRGQGTEPSAGQLPLLPTAPSGLWASRDCMSQDGVSSMPPPEPFLQ